MLSDAIDPGNENLPANAIFSGKSWPQPGGPPLQPGAGPIEIDSKYQKGLVGRPAATIK
jgi:hypothetical protein